MGQCQVSPSPAARPSRRCELWHQPAGDWRWPYSQTMGRHDADPAERRRYMAVALVTATVLALLVLGAFALNGLSHG
jgi:hypothetical protein